MRVEVVGVLVMLCLLVGAFVRDRVPRAQPQPLKFRAEFGFDAGEMRTVRGFLQSVNAAVEAGDVAGLLQRLTPGYREQLRRQVEQVGRELTPATLKAMGRLLPIEIDGRDEFVLGSSEADRVRVVWQREGVDYRAATREVCLTELSLLWNGFGFELDLPRLRHVARGDVARESKRDVGR